MMAEKRYDLYDGVGNLLDSGISYNEWLDASDGHYSDTEDLFLVDHGAEFIGFEEDE